MNFLLSLIVRHRRLLILNCGDLNLSDSYDAFFFTSVLHLELEFTSG